MARNINNKIKYHTNKLNTTLFIPTTLAQVLCIVRLHHYNKQRLWGFILLPIFIVGAALITCESDENWGLSRVHG
jgi:hypothetical protein